MGTSAPHVVTWGQGGLDCQLRQAASATHSSLLGQSGRQLTIVWLDDATMAPYNAPEAGGALVC